jgi:hypothetical protein
METPPIVQHNSPYRIKVVANGDTLGGFLDRVKLLSVTDTRYSSDQFGVILVGGRYGPYHSEGRYDDLTASPLP